jgi:hypothetical protein
VRSFGTHPQHDLVGIDHPEVRTRAVFDRSDVAAQRLDLARECGVAGRQLLRFVVELVNLTLELDRLRVAAERFARQVTDLDRDDEREPEPSCPAR